VLDIFSWDAHYLFQFGGTFGKFLYAFGFMASRFADCDVMRKTEKEGRREGAGKNREVRRKRGGEEV